MTKETHSFSDSDIPTEYYLLLLMRRWWIIIVVFVAVIALAGITSPPKARDVFETRTKILLSDHKSDGNAVSFGDLIPPEIVAIMATSGSVLARVLESGNLQNGHTGLPLTQGQLASVVNIDIQDTDKLTTITMTGRDEDPEMARRIVLAWSEIFVEEYGGLLEGEIARSDEFLLTQYEDAHIEFTDMERALATKEEEKLRHQVDSSANALENNLQVSTTQFQNQTHQLSEARGRLVDTEVKLDSVLRALSADAELLALDRKIEDEGLLALLAEGIRNLEGKQGSGPDVTPNAAAGDVNLYYRRMAVLLDSQRAALKASIEFHEGEVSQLDAERKEYSAKLEAIQLDLSRFDRGIRFLEDELGEARQHLLGMKLPENGKSSPYFVKESVKTPQTPIPTSDPLNRRLAIGAMMGLILGVAVAFTVDYLLRIRKVSRQADPAA